MIPNQPVDWQKELTPFFDLFGTKGNAKADYASLLRAEFYQKLPDDLALRMRKFKKALQDTLFFNRRYGELQIGRSLHPRALGHLIFRFQSRPSLIRGSSTTDANRNLTLSSGRKASFSDRRERSVLEEGVVH